jgi:tetratricopeptide (TPR) repeat protein
MLGGFFSDLLRRGRLLIPLAAAALVSVLTLAPAPGRAQADRSADDQARGLFQAGSTAFDAGRYEDALRYFTEAHELSGRPALLFNMGAAAERARLDDQAIEYYERYLSESEAPQRADYVRGRLEFLQSQQGERAEAPVIPSPEEAARAETASDRRVAMSPAADPKDDRLVSKWWLWTAVGVVLAGAAVGLAVALAKDGGTEEPIAGDFGPGGVIQALRSPTAGAR